MVAELVHVTSGENSLPKDKLLLHELGYIFFGLPLPQAHLRSQFRDIGKRNPLAPGIAL